MFRSTQARSGKAISRPVSAVLIMLLAALAFTSLAACTPRASGQLPGDPVSPVPSKDTVTVDLHFADDQAMEVLPERREVEVASDPSQRPPMEELVVTELLKGPKDPLLRRTFPTDTGLISVQVTDGLALANFSKELVTKHGGGSTGEMMTILSLVNSLTELPNVQKVQILVEGRKIDTLAGHADVSGPLERVIRQGDFFVSEERSKVLQERVDSGQEVWRKDPLEVAKREAPARGFLPNLEYKLAPTQGYTSVQVDYGKTYVINLYQPEKQGEDGIWVIRTISPVGE